MAASIFGAVVFDKRGRVLLRRVADDSWGSQWTWPRGPKQPGERPERTAVREVLQKTGYQVELVAMIPGEFQGVLGSSSAYWIARPKRGRAPMPFGKETAEVRWVTPDEAKELFKLSAIKSVAERDMEILAAAQTEKAKQEAAKAAKKEAERQQKRAAAAMAAAQKAKRQADARAAEKAAKAAKAASVTARSVALDAQRLVGRVPPPVLEAMQHVWDQADLVAPEHRAAIRAIADQLIADLEDRLQTLAQGKYTTVATASKALQLQALAERLGYDFGQAMGDKLQEIGKVCAGFARKGLMAQLDGWAQYTGLKQLASPRFASDLLSPGLLERYEVSRRTYGTEAIAAMRQEFAAGALTGESLKQTWDRVAARVVIPEWRAERIVRTEHSFAIHHRSFEDMRSPEVEQGLWVKELVATFDNRTGDDSAYVHGQQRPIDEPFEDNEGRVYMHPPNRPNDREVMIFVPAKMPGREELAEAHRARAEAERAAAEAAKAAEEARKRAEEEEARRRAEEEEAKRKAEEEEARKRAEADPFPEDPMELQVVRRLGGSTGAELVEDRFGRKFVRKMGGSEGHLREEFAADEAYRVLGANVPLSKLYEMGPGRRPVKLSVFLEDAVSLGDLRARAASDQKAREIYEAALVDLRQHFAADALLGSWDVIGLARDNVLVTKDGKAWRIDNGGSLRYRAQGALKGAAWDDFPMELWTMRVPRVGPETTAKEIFGPVSITQIAAQAREIAERSIDLDRVLSAHAGPEVADRVRRRLANMSAVSEQAVKMMADGFAEDYADAFGRHWLGVDQAGIVAAIPRELRHQGERRVVRIGDYSSEVFSPTYVVDENGKPWDKLRGDPNDRENMSVRIRDYINANGGDYNLVLRWASDQAGSSWYDEAVKLKEWIARKVRPERLKRYWGKDGVKDVAPMRHGERTREYEESFTALHAYSTRLMQHIGLVTRTVNGKIQVWRTEEESVMRMNKLSPAPGVWVTMPRGALESTSMFLPVSVRGKELCRYEVEPWRIFATYLQDKTRADTNGYSFLLGDKENEALVFLDNLPFEYIGTFNAWSSIQVIEGKSSSPVATKKTPTEKAAQSIATKSVKSKQKDTKIWTAEAVKADYEKKKAAYEKAKAAFEAAQAAYDKAEADFFKKVNALAGASPAKKPKLEQAVVKAAEKKHAASGKLAKARETYHAATSQYALARFHVKPPGGSG